jgi:hypothetical protein
MSEILPVIAEGHRVLVQEFSLALLVSPGNFPADLFLVFHV